MQNKLEMDQKANPTDNSIELEKEAHLAMAGDAQSKLSEDFKLAQVRGSYC